MKNNNCFFVRIGEVLWDCFEDEKRSGGAPFNFVYQAGNLGEKSAMVSRVGKEIRFLSFLILGVWRERKESTSFILSQM